MSKVRAVIAVFAVCLLVLTTALPAAIAQDEPVAAVNTGALNVRSGPGMQFGSVATLPFGFGVNLVARNQEGNWVLIALTNGVTGWVNVNYLFTHFNTNNLPVSEAAVVEPVQPTAVVTGALAPALRGDPSDDYAAIAVLTLGERVALLGRSFDSLWAQVRRADGTVGWVFAEYLTGTVPVRSLGLADGSVFVPFAPSFPGEDTSGSPGAGYGYEAYTVQPGDSLSRIAERFGTTVYAIARANHIYNYDLIYAGQVLHIPS